MPRYEFYCDDCKKVFELILTLVEYEKGKVRCPKCGKEHVHQEAAAFYAVISKKSSSTLQQRFAARQRER